MTTYSSLAPARFGSLSDQGAQSRATDAIGSAVPALEAQLGFPISVTASVGPDGTLLAEVIFPDAHYSHAAVITVSHTLQNAVRPFNVDLDIIPDSDAPYAE